jgi:hypothetical protein
LNCKVKMAARLASDFFKLLLEESQSEEKIVGDDENILLRAILVLNNKSRIVWTLRIQGGKLESINEQHENDMNGGGGREDGDSIDSETWKRSTVEIDETTVNELLAQSITPLRAFARGSIKIRGERESWKFLAGPAKRAGTKMLPLLEKDLPWPTFAEIQFLERDSSDWQPNLPKCQICGDSFGVFFPRPHHCRVCGRVVCQPCSSHKLNGKRSCSSCYYHLAVEKQSNMSMLNGSSSPGVKRFVTPKKSSTQSPIVKDSPTLLNQVLSSIRETEANSVISCASASPDETPSIKLLRSQAIAILQETRRMKKELEQVKQSSTSGVFGGALSIMNVLMITKHGFFLSLFFLSWKSLSSSTLALYFLLGFSSLWKHSLAGLLMTTAAVYSPPSGPTFLNPFLQFSQLYMETNLIKLSLAILFGTSQTVLYRMFQRLMRIYAASFSIIMVYQTARLITNSRWLKMSELQKSRVFDQIDDFVAPMACEEVLDLKSVFVKFGQYLGARSDVVPAKWSHILAKLQDDMPADRETYVIDLLKREGYAVEKDFPEFDLQPVASASIAQVHKATYSRNTQCAVKIQHENVAEMMRMDMVAFKRIMRLICYLNPRFSIAEQLLQAWESEMLKELDFNREARNLQRISAVVSGCLRG